MKRFFLLSALIAITFTGNAQQTTDTVSVGAQYANQVWYSFPNKNAGSAPKNNWDIAFDASGFGYSVLINSVAGVQCWAYPNGDTSNFVGLDTAGITNWVTLNNSDTSWNWGAFNMNANFNDQFDVGWGQYNMTTHNIIGKEIYVIKLTNGEYRKMWIKNHMNGAYNFRFAKIDNSFDTVCSLVKAPYSLKSLIYYTFNGNSVLNREPNKSEWDLLFTQYSALIPTAYTVTGVLTKKDVQTVKVYPVDNPATYNNTNHTYSLFKNIIGYNWKSFNGVQFVIEDSTVYFVKRTDGDIWKIVFTGFGGSSTGNFIFNKEKVFSSNINDIEENNGFITLYPNPTHNTDKISLVCDLANNNSDVLLQIMDISGKTVLKTKIEKQSGLINYTINTSNLNSGIYFVKVNFNNKSLVKKLIVN